MKTIGQRIRDQRESLAITLEDLGKACGTTKQSIFKYEQGIVTNIPIDRLEAIASALGVTPAYLMGWEDLEHGGGSGGPQETPPAMQQLSAPEAELVDNFRELNEEGQYLLSQNAKTMVASGLYIKSDAPLLVDEA